jgi:GNAT superfamily N-acetyltransferase
VKAPADELTIRRFCERDLDQVFELVRETIETSYASVYQPAVIAFFHDYHQRENIVSDAEGGHTVVVNSNGAFVGTGTRVETDVRRVFVRPDRQGQGIGRLIMAELEAAALKANIERLDLSASLPAKDFYLRLGYEVVSEEDYEVAPGQHLEYYEMAKDLKH